MRPSFLFRNSPSWTSLDAAKSVWSALTTSAARLSHTRLENTSWSLTASDSIRDTRHPSLPPISWSLFSSLRSRILGVNSSSYSSNSSVAAWLNRTAAAKPVTTASPERPLQHKEGDHATLETNYRSVMKKQNRTYHQSHYKPSRLPIVLCHGLFGYDTIGPVSMPRLQMHYWGGIAELLQQHRGEVYIARVPAVGSIEDRAMMLHRFLETNLRGRDVNLVAHSMGGLDSRFLVSHGPPANYRIRSLTTVSTPHRGSPLMDWFKENFGLGSMDNNRESTLQSSMARLAKSFDAPAYAHLTTEFLTQNFNPSTPNDPSVHYLSYGGSIQSPPMYHPMRFSFNLVKAKEGANDGIVSTASAKWGEYVKTLPADHFSLNKRRRDLVSLPIWQLRPAFSLSLPTAFLTPSLSANTRSGASQYDYQTRIQAMLEYHGPSMKDEYIYGFEPENVAVEAMNAETSFDAGLLYLEIMTRLYRDGL